MKLEVSATRMSLLQLKKKIVLAKKGHKLLKDKLDELMRSFLDKVKENKIVREKVNSNLEKAYKKLSNGYSTYTFDEIKHLFSISDFSLKLQTKYQAVMNLKLPTFEIETKGNIINYSLLNSSAEIDEGLLYLKEIVPDLLKLYEVETAVTALAEEIEKTRRRVNALEYILIPNIDETIKYITMKISEAERSTLSRLMKIKEIVQEH